MKFKWFRRDRCHDLDWDYESERLLILREIEHEPIHPYRAGQEGLKKRGLQWARLRRILEKKRIEEQRALGYAVNLEWEHRFLDFMEASEAFKYGAIPLGEFKAASDAFSVLAAETLRHRTAERAERRETPHTSVGTQPSVGPASSQSNMPQALPCGYCRGAGFYYCQRCRGMGSIANELSPHYTGDAVADGLIRAAYELKSVCPRCQGRCELTCYRCAGRGYGG